MIVGLKKLILRLATAPWLGWLGLVIWALVLFTLSSRSTLPPGPEIPYQDKVVHFCYFSGGGFCCALGLFARRTPQQPWWGWLLAGLVFGMGAGALDEFHQTFTPGRSGNDLGDWLADWTGASAGALLAWAVVGWARKAEQ